MEYLEIANKCKRGGKQLMNRHVTEFLRDMKAIENPAKARSCEGFFQTGKAGYGEGDKFWGLTVPQQRSICKQYYKLLNIEDLRQLLGHEVHEVRLTTLMTMVLIYQKSSDDSTRKAIVDIYLDSLERVNNWDLVDASAHYILGDWLWDKDWKLLIKLAKTEHLWTQRVAMISTFAFIRKGNSEPAFAIADLLLHHKHDLIHKAVGWMLREAGNRDFAAEYEYLKLRYKTMPRTALRYAIEKFDEPLRQAFLKGTI
jgi:3-methyladenine DNA glycosylase AlkD